MARSIQIFKMRVNKQRLSRWILFVWAVSMTLVVAFSCYNPLAAVTSYSPRGATAAAPSSVHPIPNAAGDTTEGDYDVPVKLSDEDLAAQATRHPPRPSLAPDNLPTKPPRKDSADVDANVNTEQDDSDANVNKQQQQQQLSNEDDDMRDSSRNRDDVIVDEGESRDEGREEKVSSLLLSVKSPSSVTSVTFELVSAQKCVHYSIVHDGLTAVTSSPLLLTLGWGSPALCGLVFVSKAMSSVDELWRPVFGVRSVIPNRYNLLSIAMAKETKPDVIVARLDVRAYDDGAAFRLVLTTPRSSEIFAKANFEKDVSTTFGAVINMDAGTDGTLYQDLSGENGFETHRLSEKPARGWPYNLPMHPFTVKFDNDLFMAFTEARNVEFENVKFTAGATFQTVTANFKRVDQIGTGDLTSPWFTFLLGRSPGALIEGADLVYNLNEPSAIEDVSWIRVGKVFRDLPLSTESSRAAIDLATKIGMQHILLDASWYGPETLPSSDAKKWLPTPKKSPLDLKDVIAYGKSKGVGVFLYVNDIALKKDFEKLAPLYASWGVAGIKFGFVQLDSSKDTARLMGYVRKCAEHRLMVNIHDNFRPSGYSRTYPNLVSIEGIRGDEHKETPAHALMLPFVRYLGGFADNTFVFDEERLTLMKKSVCHQIALSIIYYNPLCHIYWYRDPWSVSKIFRALPTSLRLLKVWADMPGVWDESRVLDASIGDFIAVARKDYLGNWYLATATKEARSLSISLDFLEPGVTYTMERFEDNPATLYSGSSYSTNETHRGDSYSMDLVDGGGDVAVFKKQIPTKHESKLAAVSVLPEAKGTYDSRLFSFSDDPREYRVCTMYNACVDANRIILIVEDPAVRAEYNAGSDLCQKNDPQKPAFCRCFARSLQPVFVKSLAEVGQYKGVSGHTWISDHWVNIHQIGHWVEKTVQFHSIFLAPEGYGIPRVDRIAYVKSPKMDRTEAFFYRLGTSNLGYELPEEPIFRLSSPICMQQASITSLMATMATSHADMTAFRQTTALASKVDLPVVNEGERHCPPAVTYLLIRTEPVGRLRKFLNQKEVEDRLRDDLGIVDLRIVTTNSNMTAEDQMTTFGRFGLMLSTHSSQLVFSIFAQPNAAIVEVAVTYFNSDFSSIAQRGGLFYRFALGGDVPSATTDISPAFCNKGFGSCNGEPLCIEQHTTCSKSERGEIKELDFVVDIDSVMTATRQAIAHLDRTCDGHWPGTR